MGGKERKDEPSGSVLVSGQGSDGFIRMGNTDTWGREFVWGKGKLNA